MALLMQNGKVRPAIVSVSHGWSKDTPTVGGWYWYRHDPEKYSDLPPELSEPLLLMVYDSGGQMHWQDTVNDLFGQKIGHGMNGYWAGPVVAPTFTVPTAEGARP